MSGDSLFTDKAIIQDARVHASKCYPEESCGFVVDGKYLPRNNCHDKPTEHFLISPQGYLGASKKGDIQAVVHSHPDGPRHPSRHDMEVQERGDIPWLIVPTDSAPFWFGANTPIEPYIGREFISGVTDCYSIVKDWYQQELGIKLIDLPRDEKWWEQGDDIYMANFDRGGFRRLAEDEELQEGDIVLAAILSQGIINHAAIYLGNNQIMHHLTDRLSCHDLLSTWRKYFTVRLRYNK